MRRQLATIALAAIATVALALATAAFGAASSTQLVSGPNGETEAGFPGEQVTRRSPATVASSPLSAASVKPATVSTCGT